MHQVVPSALQSVAALGRPLARVTSQRAEDPLCLSASRWKTNGRCDAMWRALSCVCIGRCFIQRVLYYCCLFWQNAKFTTNLYVFAVWLLIIHFYFKVIVINLLLAFTADVIMHTLWQLLIITKSLVKCKCQTLFSWSIFKTSF